MIVRLERRVRDAGLANVETCIANANALPFAAGSVDRALLITVLPEIRDPPWVLAELHRVLQPEGLLSITEEFHDPDYLFLPESIRLAEAAKFRSEERLGNLLVYTASFRKVT